MTLLEAIILGMVQGLTEFLPISSSGHLVLVQKLLGIDLSSESSRAMIMTYYVALHLATLFAVIIHYWKKVWEILKHPFSKFPMQILVSTIPAVILTLLLGDAIEGTYVSSALLGPGFIFTGLAIALGEKLGNGRKGLEELKTSDSLLMGAAQGIALLPSVSRSGMTITTALALGFCREFAADFSFLMSIPPIMGGVLLDTLDLVKGNTLSFEAIGLTNLLAGMAAAGITGFLAIRLMLAAVKKMKMKYFAYYVIILGLMIIGAQVFLKVLKN
jgi:undecaprenyl-diphosphatase